MNRYLLYDPKSQTYIKMTNGGWTSGHEAEEVNSYSSYNDALEAVLPFESLKGAFIVEVKKTIEILNTFLANPALHRVQSNR